MPFELPPLPYSKEALEPYMSAKTLEFHHDKHHKTYVDTLNKLVAGTPYENAKLEEIIEDTAEDEKQKSVFNNAGQVWNHTFFWNCMKHNGGGKPTGDLAQRIEKSFGDFDAFKTKFKDAAAAQFGSGWAWLVMDNNKLDIVKTGNAISPLIAGQKPLLTVDLWEHAYYLDYQNRRADMVATYLDKLVNWDFVAKNLGV
jgi:Fe-Mn family superoxide dismutase